MDAATGVSGPDVGWFGVSFQSQDPTQPSGENKVNDNRKKDAAVRISPGAIGWSSQFARKYIAALLALTISSVASPAFAGDFVNTKLLERRFPSSLGIRPATPLKTSFGGLAFAMPQPGQASEQPAQAVKQAKADSLKRTSGAKKWGGAALMILGGAMIARGAALQYPCKGFSGRNFICTSNYQTVRTSSLGVGAGSFVSGAALFALRNR